MSPSSLSNGEGINMPAKFRNLYNPQKLDIRINLTNPKKTYTTLDKLEGDASITAPVDTSFDEIDIEFVGTSRTYVERLTTAAAVSGRSEAFHQFLKLQQPRMSRRYPEDRVLKAGQTYTFPFVFVVPEQLLPRVCRHNVVTDTVRDVHVQLPPTFGDKDLEIDVLDDMVPDMASIRYGIFARVSKDKEQGEKLVRTTLTSKAKRLRVIPTTQEQPPLDVGGKDSEYIMRKERLIRKGVLKGKLGTLVMEAAQPPPVRLHAGNNSESQSSSMATIMLRFDPIDENAPPPRLGSLSAKLKVCTYFASTARSCLPCKASSAVDLTQGLHTEQMNLSSRCMANVEWTKHTHAASRLHDRRDSALSFGSITFGGIPEPSTAYKNKSYYVARLLVPISMPTNKTFVPTFHSCLISRIYQLKLELGVQTANLGSMDLKLPFQICSESSSESTSRSASIASSLQADIDNANIDEFFEPRTIRAPSGDLIENSHIGIQEPIDDALPGYSLFAHTRAGQVSVH